MDGALSCQQNRMRQVAERDHTDVLEYVFDTPSRDADAVTCVKLAQRTLEARAALAAGTPLKKAAKEIRQSDPLLKQFSTTHPQTFACMLDPEHSGRAFRMLETLARIRKGVEAGMSEAEANVHANRVIMEKTMRDPTATEKEEFSQKSSENPHEKPE